MGIIQPLYYPGGKYKPKDDRKILAALTGFESDGTNTVGVIGSPNLTSSTGLMKVAASGTAGSITVQPGLCVIPDAAPQDAELLGVYLAGIDSVELTVALSLPVSGTRTDLIYALVSEDVDYVSTAARSGTTVTLTTTAAHGFSVGDTVVVRGLDEVFNGTFTATAGTTGSTIVYSTSSSGTISSVTYNATAQRIDSQGVTLGSPIVLTNRAFAQSGTTANGTATITTTSVHSLAIGDTIRISGLSSVLDGDFVVATVPTTTTFTYTRSWNGTAVTALGTPAALVNANAQARVPFAIKQATGTTAMPTATGIPLAEVTVSTTTVTAVKDRRLFVGANGGVHYYDSTAGGATNALRPAVAAEGRLAYDVSANVLYYSNGSSWSQISTATHNHDTTYYPAPQSASGVLTKPTSFSTSGGYLDVVTGTSFDDATGATFVDGNTGLNVAASVTCIAACYVLVEFSAYIWSASSTAICQVDVQLSGATTTSAFTVAATGSNSKAATDGTAMTTGDWIYHSYAAYGANIATHSRTKLYKVNAGTTTFTLRGKINSSAQAALVDDLSLRLIPLYNA